MFRACSLALVASLLAAPALADPKDQTGYGIPPGHMPPPGACRVWFDGVPPGQQPPPVSCEDAQSYAYWYGGRVIWGGERR